MDTNTQQVLLDFVATSRADGFNVDMTLNKFPQLQLVDQQLLLDFLATSRAYNYDMDAVFKKFPQITGQLEKPEEPGKTEGPTIYRGTPIVGSEQGPSATEEEVQEEQPDYLSIPIKDRDYSSFDTDEKKIEHQYKIEAERILTSTTIDYSNSLAKVPGYSMAATLQYNIDVVAKAIKDGTWDGEDVVFQDPDDPYIPEELKTDTQKSEEKVGAEGSGQGFGAQAEDVTLLNFETLTGQDEDLVLKKFEESPDYPGLRINKISERDLLFTLPDGSQVYVANAQFGDSNINLEQYKKVRQWYRTNKVKAEALDLDNNLGLFRILGNRSDREGKFFEDIDSINKELNAAGFTIMKDPSSSNYRVFSKDNTRSFTGSANQVQKWLYTNLNDNDIAALRESTTQATLDVVYAYQAGRQEAIDNALNTGQADDFIDTLVGSLEVDGNGFVTGMQGRGRNRNTKDQAVIGGETVDLKALITATVNESDLSDEAKSMILGSANKGYVNETAANYDSDNVAEQAATDFLVIPVGINASHQFRGDAQRAKESGYFSAQTIDAAPEWSLRHNYNEFTTLSAADWVERGYAPDDAQKLELMFKGPGGPYNEIFNRQFVEEKAITQASDNTDKWLSLLFTKEDQDRDLSKEIPDYTEDGKKQYELQDGTFTTDVNDPNIKLDSNGKPVIKYMDFRPEAISATVDEIRSQADYLDNSAGRSDEYLQVTDDYDTLFDLYKERGEEIKSENEKNLNAVLKKVEAAGLGYEVIGGNRIVVLGLDEDEVNAYQRMVNDELYAQIELNSKYAEGLTALTQDHHQLISDALNVGVISDKNYDFGDILLDDFEEGAESIVTGIASFFGNDEALRIKGSSAAGAESYEQMYDYNDAIAEGLGWRFTARTSAQQGANVMLAIGTNLVLPGAGQYLVPVMFGLSAGGDTRFQIKQTMDAAEKAEKALAALEKDFKLGKVGEYQYGQTKVALEQTIAMGDLSTAQIEAAVISSALVEGGVSYYLGTNPNSRSAIKAVTGAGDDIVSAITTSGWKQTMNALGKVGREIGSEIAEEELIYFGNELTGSMFLGKDADFSQWDDIAVTAAITSGPMTGLSNGVNLMRSLYVTNEARQSYFEGKQQIEDLRASIEGLSSVDPAMQQLVRDKISNIVQTKFAYATSEMEINAIVNGTAGLDQMMRAGKIENEIYRKAKIKHTDSITVKNNKMEIYRNSLDEKGKKDLDTQLSLANETRAGVLANSERIFEREATGENGTINEFFGERGKRIADNLSRRTTMDFNGMSNKDKLIAVHQESRERVKKDQIARMKKNEDVRKAVERHVYGNEKGFEGSGRATRKRKAENAAYEVMASMVTARQTEATVTYTGQYTNAQKILSSQEISNVSFEEFANVEDMRNHIVENWERLGYSSQDAAERFAAQQTSVDNFGALITMPNGKTKYLTFNKEQAQQKLKEGKLLQGTMFSHEVSHALDDLAFKGNEIKDFAQNLFDTMDSTEELRHLNDLAIHNNTSLKSDEARLRLKDDSQPYHRTKNPVLPMSQQTVTAADEYTKIVQDFLQDPSNAKAFAIAKKSGQGLGNLWRGVVGGDFTFDSKGAALNYIVGHIEAFNRGEISRQTKRRISARVLSDEQIKEEVESGAMNSEDVSSNKQQASDRVQKLWEKGDVASVIDEFDGINTDDAAKAKSKGQNVERKKSLLESILKPYSRVAGFNMEDGKMALMTHPRGFLGLVQEYNIEKGVPLAAWLNKYLPERVKEIVGTIGADGQFTVDIDSPAVVAVADDNDGVSHEMERRGKGVKLWTRFGDKGNSIHNSIIADVINGTIKTDGQNYKTLGGKRFYEVMDMMGINPVNKAGKPKTGNLDQTDVSNAQRWIQQHISEIRSAVIPQHSTTKMVKNPNTGKLEPRPDKAIGIPQVLLNSELFTKHTRKDNLTGYSFNDGLTDAEILSMFGVTKRGEPNTKLKDDRNIGQKIKALVKLTDMAMTNQGARVAMENRGDHISEILHLADGRSLNLYSEDVDPTGGGIIEMLTGDTIEGFQDEAKLVADIALDVGYNTPQFHQRVAEEGISISVLQYLESINFEKYFAKGDQGLKNPLRAAVGTGKFKPGAEALLNKFFENKIDVDDVTANKQLASGAKSLIKSLPAPLVKALGPQFFGLLGSNRGLNKNKNQDVYDAYQAKTEGVVAQPGIVLLNANTGLMQKIQRVLVDPNLNAKQKEARVKELYGKDIDAANENNAVALKQVLEAMSKTTDANARLGIMRMFEIGSNNTLGIRGLTTLDAIQYTDVSQARFIGIHKNTGKVVHFASNPTASQKNIYDIELNTKHPNYAAAESYADRKSKAASLTKTGKRKKNYTDEKIQKHKQKILEDALKFKGEHVTPSANTQRLMVEALLQAWYDGGFDMATASEELTANFAQTLGAKIFSDLQDDALGTTSTADQLRMLAIQNDVNIDEFVDTREGQAFSSYVRSFITNKETLKQVQENISKDKSAKFPELKERLSSILDDTVSDIELQKTATDVRKANNKYSEDTSPKGMTAWDFDDTLATTKSNVIFTKDGETKIVSAEDFATQGADLVAEGWTPDFSEFNKVTGGKPGPMFDKAMERARKYGTEDTYILTARAPEAAPAIKEFLDALGLNIPLENITGLGNSTGEAKARWLLDKHAQGYNDIAFADDAMQNVEAVRKVFDENDIKGKVEQAKAKFSEDVDITFVNQILSEGESEINLQFQAVLEQTTGVDRRKVFSAVKARQRGKGKGKFKFFLPPSAEDFKGLMYSFMGKGEVGEKHHAWFKKNLFDPYSKGMIRINSLNQEISNNMRSLKKSIPGIKNKLRDKVGDTNFTNEQAIRVFNWNRNGIEVPGLSRADLNTLVKAVNNDADLKIFADNASDIANKIGVDQNPGVAWLAGSVSSDMNDMLKDSRAALLQEFNSNADAVFSDKNLNKIEAIYGSNFREALEDILYRMKTGSTRPQGQSRIMNNFMNWINGSVGTTMFFNARSAMLQMISNVNFINWHDNNPLKAAKAFANQKQYWSDVAMIFNSDYLKQRRGGLGTDLNAAELLKDLQQGDKPMKTAIAHLLQLGFTPTQIADSFAIATGGATMYRNRVNSYVEQGMNKQEAESKAFEDMREISEETQQSTRPDKISQQQASPLGKLILAFQNTPMQYNRIIKRAAQDWVNGRGDWRQHLSKIAYYGGVQSMIFYGLQTALWSSLFGDDDEEDLEEKQSRVINGMMDSLLRGGGIGGAVVATAKNTILEFIEQDAKNDDGVYFTDPNHAYTIIEALNLSPPIGIKARKLYSATQTYQFNRDVIDQMSKTDIDNPIYDATFSATEALTNIPLSRLYNKYQNISEAMNSDNETWQRVAMLLGWSRWSFGIQNSDVMSAKQEVKEIKAKETEERREQKKQEREAEKQAANEAVIQGHIEEQQEQRDNNVAEEEIRCAAVKGNGERCSNKVLPGESYCTIHMPVPQQANEVQCSHIKSDGKRCKMKTKNKSGKCYYHD